MRWFEPAFIAVAMLLFAQPAQAEDIKCWRAEDSRWDGARSVDGSAFRSAKDLLKFGGQPVIVNDLKLPGADFSGIRLKNICIQRGDLSRTNWRGARISNFVFSDVDLKDTLLLRANVTKTLFVNSVLSGVDASHASFRGSTIAGGQIEGARFDRAGMRNFRLRCELVQEQWWSVCSFGDTASMVGADLTGARLETDYLDGWSFGSARLAHTRIRMAALMAFRNTDVRGPITIESSGYHNALATELSVAEWRTLVSNLRDARSLRIGDKDGPSFDCRGARSSTEIILCRRGDYGYRSIVAHDDVEMAQYYAALRQVGRVSVNDQRAWLRQRDLCASAETEQQEDCLQLRYRNRIAFFKDRLRGSGMVRTGESRLYIDIALPTSARFKTSRLYDKILPLILASASELVAVRRSSATTVDFKAFSYGSNLHSCDANGRFAIDPTDGRISAEESTHDRPFPIAESYGRWLTVVAETDLYFVVCGARAHWDEKLQAIDVPQDVLQRIFGDTKHGSLDNISQQFVPFGSVSRQR